MNMRRTRIASAAPGLALLVAGLIATGTPARAADQCQGRTVSIAATADGQRLTGTEGADVISAEGFGAVEVSGLGGADVICASAGLGSVVDGGTGEDTLVDSEAGATAASETPTVLLGGPGADHYLGVDGTVVSYERVARGVRIDLSAGTVVDGHEVDTLSGIHAVVGTLRDDSFVGSAQADLYTSSPFDSDHLEDRDTISTGAGADTVYAYGATVHTGLGDDRVSATGAAIYGGAGDDTLFLGLGGRIVGGPGDDRLRANVDYESELIVRPVKSRFRILGGSGDDVVETPYAEDTDQSDCPRACARSVLRGGPGNDTVDLQWTRQAVVDLRTGRARVLGGRMRMDSFENVRGGSAADVIKGDARRNVLSGGGGADVLVGRGGADILRGGRGRDRADGGRGRDRCRAEMRRSCP